MKLLNLFMSSLLEFLRPLLGPASCRFTISCGKFALQELKEKTLLAAFWSITKRFLSCNPLYKGVKNN